MTAPVPARPVDQPSAISPAAFRACVGEFATGVTVVTAGTGEDAAGMTLNSFVSVSLDPLMVLVSLAHDSRTLAALEPVGMFAVSFLKRSQREIALRFARRGAGFPHYLVEEHDRCLFVRDALGHLACRVVSRVPAGDHDLVIGQVVTLRHDEGEPLVFHRGRLGGLMIDAHVATDSLGGWDLGD
jgi:3-hydroxy-9,10-secoandrosta-1,3,5(10)-triene-9,17-dione monooxygenase reductase component